MFTQTELKAFTEEKLNLRLDEKDLHDLFDNIKKLKKTEYRFSNPFDFLKFEKKDFQKPISIRLDSPDSQRVSLSSNTKTRDVFNQILTLNPQESRQSILNQDGAYEISDLHRLVIEPEKKIHLLLIPRHDTLGFSQLELTIKENAQVELLILNDAKDTSHLNVIATIEKNAHLNLIHLNFNNQKTRTNISTELTGTEAHIGLYTLNLNKSDEASDLRSVIHHLAPNTTSEQVNKSILHHTSKAIFSGKIHIHQKAQEVSSSQLSKSLLLSTKAQSISEPQLEIFADNVKCSHGSTTGQLSTDEIFYFRSRGINEARAKALLTLGFALEIIQKIDHSEMREKVSDYAKDYLEKFFMGKDL